MAEDSREIVYYKGKKYYIEAMIEGSLSPKEKGNLMIHLIDITSPTIRLFVEAKNVMTEEQHQEYLSKQRSKHVNWIR